MTKGSDKGVVTARTTAKVEGIVADWPEAALAMPANMALSGTEVRPLASA